MSNILCKECKYFDDISTYEPTASVYSDIRCPSCGSTNNEHNAEYLTNLMEAMREPTVKEKE